MAEHEKPTRTELASATACHECGYVLELATALGDLKVPESGSISICIRCGAIGAFHVGPLGVRIQPVSEELRAEVLADPRMQEIQRARARAIRQEPLS